MVVVLLLNYAVAVSFCLNIDFLWISLYGLWCVFVIGYVLCLVLGVSRGVSLRLGCFAVGFGFGFECDYVRAVGF